MVLVFSPFSSFYPTVHSPDSVKWTFWPSSLVGPWFSHFLSPEFLLLSLGKWLKQQSEEHGFKTPPALCLAPALRSRWPWENSIPSTHLSLLFCQPRTKWFHYITEFLCQLHEPPPYELPGLRTLPRKFNPDQFPRRTRGRQLFHG